MVLGNTLNILRPPARAIIPVQTRWNEDLVKNMHDVLGRMSQQISTITVAKAGTDTIADSATTEAVTFSTDSTSINYSVALAADGNELVWVTSKVVSGFTLNRSASSGARVVDWTVTLHNNL